MALLQRVRWTISPRTPPEPWRNCTRCGFPRPFRCSGKFRLNANGKRLDAWLIYKCVHCDETWNRAVVERRMARDVDPAMLAGFETNDADLVRRFAFDVAALRASCRRVDEFSDVTVSKEAISEMAAEAQRPLFGHDAAAVGLEIRLRVRAPVSMRLDRLLSLELGLSRGRIAALSDARGLTASQSLSKPVRDGTIVSLTFDASRTDQRL